MGKKDIEISYLHLSTLEGNQEGWYMQKQCTMNHQFQTKLENMLFNDSLHSPERIHKDVVNRGSSQPIV